MVTHVDGRGSLKRSPLSWRTAVLILGAVGLGVLLAGLPLEIGVILVAGTAVVILTLINPFVGLFLALLAAPFGALESAVFGPSPFDSGQLILLFTFAVWLGRGLAYRQINIPRTFLNVPLAIFIFVAALSLLNAPSLTVGFKELLKWLEIAAIMLFIVDLSGSSVKKAHAKPQSRKGTLNTEYQSLSMVTILVMLFGAGLLQAFIGIWQFGLRDDGPEHFLVLGRFYRAYGTFEQPNPFAGYMNLTALLAIGVLLGLLAYLWQQFRNADSPHHPVTLPSLLLLGVVGFTAVATTLAVFFSWSRGAWLSFAAGTAVIALFWPKKLWQGVLLLLIGGMLFLGGVEAGVVPASVTERISSFSEDLRFGDVRGADINDANYAVLERLAHWQAALDMAKENLWLGVGFGNYEPAYAGYALINWPYPLGHAHNYYLNALAEIGVLGLLAYVGLWTAVFWQTIRQLRDLDWPERGIALGLLAVWTAVTVHHLVDKLYVNNMYIHLGVMFGLLQLLELKRQSNSTKEVLNRTQSLR